MAIPEINGRAPSNNEFISAILHGRRQGVIGWSAQFTADPDHSYEWAGQPWPPCEGIDWDAQANAYVCTATFRPQATRRTTEEVLSVHCLVLDDIGQKCPQERLDTLPRASWIIETSPDCYQAGYVFRDPVSPQDAQRLYDLVKTAGLGDKSGHSVTRYIRCPNGVNTKGDVVRKNGGPFNIRLVRWQPAVLVAVEELELALRQAASSYRADIEAKVLREQDKETSEGVQKGGRNDAVFREGGRLRRQGATKDEAREHLLKMADNCSPPLNRKEALKCLESAWRYPVNHALNDLGNAKRFAELHAGMFVFVNETGKWLRRVGEIYERACPSHLSTAAERVVEALKAKETKAGRGLLAKQRQKFATKTGQAPRIRAMLDLASRLPEFEVELSALDSDPLQAGTDSGVIDLRKGALVSTAAVITKRLGASFDPQAECPRFELFLQQVFEGDMDLIKFVQRAAGYLLTGATDEQVAFWFYGPGANGKTVLLNTLQKVVGDYATSLPSHALQQARFPHQFGLGHLPGARMVRLAEIGPDYCLNEALFNDMTGGDPITGEVKFKDRFEFKMMGKIVCATNHLPRISSYTHGIWRRQIVVPMNHIIPPEKQDRRLEEGLRGELSGILNWMLEGCRQWQEIGLAAPKSVLNSVAEYRQEEDLLEEWFTSCCMLGSYSHTSAADLLGSCNTFLLGNQRKTVSSQALGRWLTQKKGLQKKKPGTVVYTGVELRRGED